MNYEELPPEDFTEKLKNRQQELTQLLNKKLRLLKKAPEGHLRIAQAHGGRKLQYYHITDRGDTRGTYIPHSQLQFAIQLAQKQYDQNLIKILRRQIAAIEGLLAAAGPQIPPLYETQCRARRLLITPATLPDEQYAELWRNVKCHPRPFAPDAPEFFTARGERVRSKSEVIIADSLDRHKIPYRYEFPLELKNGDIYHPDFLCLNLRTRQEFIWEHFGMMDKTDYAENTVRKLKVFSENKIFPGKNLLITMESSKIPLSSRQVEVLITEFLK